MLKLAAVALTAVLVLAGITVAVPARSGTAVGHPIPQTRISIVSSEVPVIAGVARVRLSCQMGEAIRLTCRGVLSLQTRGAQGTSGRLGQARFAIASCCSAPWHTVGVDLNQAGRNGLRATPVRVRAHAVLDKGAASATRVVSLVRGG